MTIETYHLVLGAVGLAASLASLMQPWIERARLLLIVIVVTTFFVIVGGEFIMSASREWQIGRAVDQLPQQLGTWGRPFDDLRREMSNFPPDVTQEALRRAENTNKVKRVSRTVRDPSNAQDYEIDVFMLKE